MAWILFSERNKWLKEKKEKIFHFQQTFVDSLKPT